MGQDISAAELAVLLIEPSEVQRRILTRSLQETGVWGAEAVANLADARSAIRASRPDLIISAMYFDDGTAEELLLELRQSPPTADLPFMLVSSVRDRQRLEVLRQSGILAILPKPFGPSDLDRAIRAGTELLSQEEIELDCFDITALRILLVDDSRMARAYVRRVLESVGAEQFVEAINGREAVEALHQQPFDLIVTDYNMPEMDGRELTAYVRENPAFTHLPVLMVSSEADQAKLSAITQAGVDAILDKPFEPSTARETLQRLLGAHS